MVFFSYAIIFIRKEVFQMVKHVLMIKLKDNSKEQCEKLRDLL